MIRHSGLKTSRLARRMSFRACNTERFWVRSRLNNGSDGYVDGEFAITSFYETRRCYYGTGRTQNPSKEAFYRINPWVKR